MAPAGRQLEENDNDRYILWERPDFIMNIVDFSENCPVTFYGQSQFDGVCNLFNMKRLQKQPFLWLVIVFLGVVPVSGAAVESDADMPRKVLLIGVDGCRFDAIEAAETPNFDLILKRSAWSRRMRVLSPDHGSSGESVMTTHGPGWATALTGVWHDRHGFINDSVDRHRQKKESSANFFDHSQSADSDAPDYPTIFERLQKSEPDFYTVSLTTWAPLNHFIAHKADLQRNFSEAGRSPYLADQRAADEFSALLMEELAPDFTFLLLSQINEEGERGGYGPSSHSYIAAVERVDTLIGQVVKSISDRVQTTQEEWLILITSDHGGEGFHHTYGFRNPAIDTTFLIAFGPTITRGEIEGETALVDIAAMALDHLGFLHSYMSPSIDGRLPKLPGADPVEVVEEYARSFEKSFNALEAQFHLLDELRQPVLIDDASAEVHMNPREMDQLALFNSQLDQLESAALEQRQLEMEFLHKTYKYSLIAIFPVFLLTIVGLVIGEMIHGRCLEKATLFFAQGINLKNPLQMVKSTALESEIPDSEDEFSWIDEQEVSYEAASGQPPPTVHKWTLPKKSSKAHAG
jgi:hypothetical protein